MNIILSSLIAHAQTVSTVLSLEVYIWLSFQEIIYYSTEKWAVRWQLLAVSAFGILLSFWIMTLSFWGCSQTMSHIAA